MHGLGVLRAAGRRALADGPDGLVGNGNAAPSIGRNARRPGLELPQQCLDSLARLPLLELLPNGQVHAEAPGEAPGHFLGDEAVRLKQHVAAVGVAEEHPLATYAVQHLCRDDARAVEAWFRVPSVLAPDVQLAAQLSTHAVEVGVRWEEAELDVRERPNLLAPGLVDLSDERVRSLRRLDAALPIRSNPKLGLNLWALGCFPLHQSAANRQQLLGIEASAADHETIYVRELRKLSRVAFVHRTGVDESAAASRNLADVFLQPAAQGRVHTLRLLRAAGLGTLADGPHGLVGDDHAVPAVRRHACRGGAELHHQDIQCPAGLAVLQLLADGEVDVQAAGEALGNLLRDVGVALAQDVTAVGMPQ
mmetsp:Transcript_70902/g.203149  ORF Transcript_70902/g.203149 Transcript_70902/m.203149 type:complete len:364 (+) Transcript_70902:355-1446(+)